MSDADHWQDPYYIELMLDWVPIRCRVPVAMTLICQYLDLDRRQDAARVLADVRAQNKIVINWLYEDANTCPNLKKQLLQVASAFGIDFARK